MTTQPKQQPTVCPKCHSTFTVKKGKRRNRFQIVQVFQCTDCNHRFSTNAGKNKKYPLHLILGAASLYNLGYSVTETQQILRKKKNISIPERTINLWLADHRGLLSYWRIRRSGKALFPPPRVIRSLTLLHQQVYRFQVHQPKQELLFQSPEHQHLASIKPYLSGVDA